MYRASSLLPRRRTCHPWSVDLFAAFLTLLPGQWVRLKKWLLVPHSLPTGEAHKPQEDPIALLPYVYRSHSGHRLIWTACEALPDGTILPAGLWKVQTSPRGFLQIVLDTNSRQRGV